MVNIIFTALSFVVLGVAVFISQSRTSLPSIDNAAEEQKIAEVQKQVEQVLSDTDASSSGKEKVENLSESTISAVNENLSTREISKPQNLNSTPSPQPKNTNDELVYSGSKKVSESDGVAVYSTNDSPLKVTAWYKTLFRESGYKTTTAVQTSTNGVVVNKFVVLKGDYAYEIAIESKEEASKIMIKTIPDPQNIKTSVSVIN